MKTGYIFTDQESSLIEKAIKEVERETSGEIVPIYTYRSNSYEHANWKSAMIMTILGGLGLIICSVQWWLPFHITPIETITFILALGLVGFLIPLILPWTIRYLLPQNTLNQHVINSAKAAFLEEELFDTLDRCGILIYISHLEHKVVLIADAGINKKVQAHDWEEVVSIIVSGIKSRKPINGLLDGILKCKEILLRHEFHRRDDDRNELPDELLIR